MNGGNLLARYTWIVDILRRYGRISRGEFNARWANSRFGDGAPMPRRTFYNYRQSISELFGIEITYDKRTNEYFIEGDTSAPAGASAHDQSVTDWLLNSAAMSGVLSDARAVSHRIFVEDVPSARHNLAPVLDALNHDIAIRFTYNPFTRSMPTRGVEIEPYLIKLFRQRWYVAGRNVAENRLKTYALDRMSAIELTSRRFEMPADFDPAEYFRNSFGIVVDSSRPRRVVLRTDPRQAKYLRALPLHSSQTEMVHDAFSEFTYTLLLTEDFLKELMTLGPSVTVISPPELRLMLTDRLRRTLDLYSSLNEE